MNSLIILLVGVAVLLVGCEPIRIPDTGKTHTLPTYAGPPVLDDSQWSLILLNGKALVEGSAVSLNMVENTINGNGSCNRYNGRFVIEDDTIRFYNISSTRLGCKHLGQEHEYFSALSAVAAYSITDDSFTLSDAEGNEILVFAPMVHAPLEKTQWVMAFYYRQASMASSLNGTEVTAQFAAGTVTGSGGCNDYSAKYDTDDAGLLTITMPMRTKKACPSDDGSNGVMDQEDAVLANLEQAVTYEIRGDKLTISDGNGQALFEFKVQK